LGCPWVGQNERNDNKIGKLIKTICSPNLHKDLPFLSGSSQHSEYH